MSSGDLFSLAAVAVDNTRSLQKSQDGMLHCHIGVGGLLKGTHLNVFCNCLLTKVGSIPMVPADSLTTSCAVPDRLPYV